MMDTGVPTLRLVKGEKESDTAASDQTSNPESEGRSKGLRTFEVQYCVNVLATGGVSIEAHTLEEAKAIFEDDLEGCCKQDGISWSDVNEQWGEDKDREAVLNSIWYEDGEYV